VLENETLRGVAPRTRRWGCEPAVYRSGSGLGEGRKKADFVV